MKKITLSLLVLLSVVIYSCKDESDDPAPKQSQPLTLNGTTWLLTGFTVDPPIDFFGVKISDFYAMMDDCEKDDETTFNADGTYLTTEGATKCDPSDPQEVATGTWSMTSDQKKFIMDGDTVSVQSFTSTKLVLGDSEYDPDTETTYTYRMTFTKK